MATSKEDKMLGELSEDIDNELLKWLKTYEVAPLNLIAILLARLTWLAKVSDCKDDFIELLKAPERVLNTEEDKEVLH